MNLQLFKVSYLPSSFTQELILKHFLLLLPLWSFSQTYVLILSSSQELFFLYFSCTPTLYYHFYFFGKLFYCISCVSLYFLIFLTPPPPTVLFPVSFLSLSFFRLLFNLCCLFLLLSIFPFAPPHPHPALTHLFFSFSHPFSSLSQFLPCLSFPFNLLLFFPVHFYSSFCFFFTLLTVLFLFFLLLFLPSLPPPLPTLTSSSSSSPLPSLSCPSSCPYYFNPPFLPCLNDSLRSKVILSFLVFIFYNTTYSRLQGIALEGRMYGGMLGRKSGF